MLARGRKKIQTDPALCQRTPICGWATVCSGFKKIAAFGGGVKRNFQDPKRGVGGSPGHHGSDANRAKVERANWVRCPRAATEHEPLDTAMLVTLRRPNLEDCSTKAYRSEEHTSELQSLRHLVC